jgi:site-specific DNA-methyltransferase (adenine-specific)
MINLMQGDCLERMKEIESGSVDMILTDPPYGTMNGFNGIDWDFTIEPKVVFAEANRMLRKNGKLILFSQEPYSSSLITQSAPNIPFSYRMIWEKDSFANALLCNKAPVGFMEDILVFGKTYDLKYVTPNNPMFKYFKDCKKNSDLTTTQFNQIYCSYVGKTKNTHRGMIARCWETSQFWFPNKSIYENVLQTTGFFPKKWEDLKKINDQFHSRYLSTFNLWEGNKFKSNILKYKKDQGGYHPTQKPVLLLEDLIKTYTNERETVLDFTMGSGSTGVAAKNLNRKFIGIEMDEAYFKIAQDRIENA